MSLNVQNVYFENQWIVEYVTDQYILKNKNIYIKFRRKWIIYKFG